MYVDRGTLEQAVARLYGTAGHLLKIWLTLKHMGLARESAPIEIDTANSTPALKRLFSYGAEDEGFYIPFAHTPRYLTMKWDASRSVIQTTVQRWASSGSVVTCDPTEYLEISSGAGAKPTVSCTRSYPFGLGMGESGFALKDGVRVSLPLTSFAVWYGRQTQIPDDVDAASYLKQVMLDELNISETEQALIFLDDRLSVFTQISPLEDREVFSVCEPFIGGRKAVAAEIHVEDFGNYARRVRSMVSGLDMPGWLRTSPETEVRQLLEDGAKAILLYGPPRTGKTRLIDNIVQRDEANRATIQIHDGWGYDHLVEGFKPDENGQWVWQAGPLKEAIEGGKKYIVLEEINRTAISQALGEVFSLIEESYRGEENGILLRSGESFSIPADVVFLMTMNTIDKSTEDVDDALLGRVSAVAFPPRPEDLKRILAANNVSAELQDKITQLYAEILTVYPLGHGYFAGLSGDTTQAHVIRHYKARVRPVLTNFLGELKRQELAKLDNLVDALFA